MCEPVRIKVARGGLDVRPADGRVKVQGINMVTRHRRPTQNNAGGIEQVEATIHISNVALIDPETKRATRVGYDLSGGKKNRIARKSGKTID